MNIVIADDNAVALKLLRNALLQAGHEVQTAVNGRQALEAMNDGKCRLVIADWQMPEMDGLELCRTVRSAGFPGYVYFILLTSRGGKQDKLEALSAGVDDFITKPFDRAELAAKLFGAERLLSMETRELTIFALAKLAESRDPETGLHLERVRNYTRLLARELSLRPEYAREVTGNFVRTIYQTSPLHDIGKVAIPDCVLLKPGRLNDQEFEVMKTHTTLGAQTLQAALREHPGAEFLRMASQIALTHHERFDGSGYPAGLNGQNIPLCGRIMAVADVYDALTSKRVYKPAFDHLIAGSIIREGSGTHFDPALVEIFRTLERQFSEIRAAFSDVSARADYDPALLDCQRVVQDGFEATRVTLKSTSPAAIPAAEAPLKSGMDPAISQFLPAYIESLPRQVAEIEELARGADIESLRRALHDVKGTSGIYGFPQITAAAAEAEQQLINTNSIERIADQVRAMAQLIRRVEGFNKSEGSGHAKDISC